MGSSIMLCLRSELATNRAAWDIMFSGARRALFMVIQVENLWPMNPFFLLEWVKFFREGKFAADFFFFLLSHHGRLTVTPECFQGKRCSELVFHCLPLHHDTDILLLLNPRCISASRKIPDHYGGFRRLQGFSAVAGLLLSSISPSNPLTTEWANPLTTEWVTSSL